MLNLKPGFHSGIAKISIARDIDKKAEITNLSPLPIYDVTAFFEEGEYVQFLNILRKRRTYIHGNIATLLPNETIKFELCELPACGVVGGLSWGVEYLATNDLIYEYKESEDFTGYYEFSFSEARINLGKTFLHLTFHNIKFWIFVLILVALLIAVNTGLLSLDTILDIYSKLK